MNRDRHRSGDRLPNGRAFPDQDRVNNLIDDVSATEPGGHERHATDPAEVDEVTAVLSRVNALAEEPVPASARDRHLARIRTADPAPGRRRRSTTAASVRWPSGLRRRLVPVTAAATMLLLVAGGGTVAAAQDADPDDTLYGVKRMSEQVWAALPRDGERAAAVHLALAERRLGEARRAPRHAERLVAEGVADAEQAAEELPDEAVETLSRLLGDGEGSLPAQASPAARAALHRNCVKIAAKRGLDDSPCGPAPDFAHPGRGPARGHDRGEPGENGRRGWGPGGRPDGEVGPPPGVPGRDRGRKADREDGPPYGHGWGSGGRPDGAVGPPPGVPGWGPEGRPDDWVGPPPGVPGRGPATRDADPAPRDDGGVDD